MVARRLEIEEMILRLPGVPVWQAREIAAEVLAKLAARWPAAGLRRVPAGLDLKVNVAANIPADRLGEAIVDRLLERLQ